MFGSIRETGPWDEAKTMTSARIDRAAWRQRQNRLHQELEEQWREIMKHKWIQSEKAGRDLGTQAIMDWIKTYAADWRAARA